MSDNKSLLSAGVSSIVAAAIKPIPDAHYSYWAAIKTPTEQGGSYQARQLHTNPEVINNYTNLYFGNSAASRTGEVLGNRFFVPTGTTCMAGGNEVDRYMFVDNIPTQSTPGTGGETGIVPGMLKDLEGLNPISLIAVFGDGIPDCSEVTLKTNGQTTSGTETQYMADGDIALIDACAFDGGKNTKTNALCEGFTNLNGVKSNKMPRDRYLSLYLLLISLLGFYITMKVMNKK